MTIERYTRPEMKNIWSLEKKYETWLEVEIEACQAWANLDEIPQEDVDKIKQNASFTVERILEIEEETRHDVVAFTRCVSESLGDESKWIHYGLTSTDVVDTAYGFQLKQVNDILRKDIQRII
ncbi:MAG: lyase family protein, partial [Ruoffia tabacinasalis]